MSEPTSSTISAAYKLVKANAFSGIGKYDGIILFAAAKELEKKDFAKKLPILSKNQMEAVATHAKRIAFAAKDYAGFSFDLNSEQRLLVMSIPENAEMFSLLQHLRENFQPLNAAKCKNILVAWADFPSAMQKILTDASISVVGTQNFSAPKYSQKKPTPKHRQVAHILTSKENFAEMETNARQADSLAQATNYVRQLALRAGNDLTCKTYVQFLKGVAQENKLAFEFFSFERLQKMGAGAFLAVAQGSKDKDAGIVRLTYKPKRAPKDDKMPRLCLVGKGVTFDTGGVNLKPGTYMFGMHMDMTGSAVSSALMLHAIKNQWPMQITTYLAIAENAVSADAYRPNDVVTSLSGKTIEIVHTDAEGRMMLADTLWLASEDKPDLILDFATLTGACVHAIGTTYSGAFTNRKDFWPHIMAAGQESGERVWPFPLDKDFGECLKSDVADIKQCRLKGGVDHIEAACFLKEFIQGDVPWVHLDLSAAENEGGLAHVSTRETGFGVRFAHSFIKKVFPNLY